MSAKINICKCWKKDNTINLHFGVNKIPIDWTDIWLEDVSGTQFHICDTDDDLFRHISRAQETQKTVTVQVNKWYLWITSIEFNDQYFPNWEFGLKMFDTVVFGMFAIIMSFGFVLYIDYSSSLPG